MIIGTAGHIDHGKTSLVRSLTGVDTDRLAEEKARGITIELGFAYQGELGFVDVPGHERLVRTMLAGATGIDHVLLVVAADDGPMPQTREHLAILNLLGLTRGAVVLTKADLVAVDRLAAAQREVEALLVDSVLANAPVFAVSTVTGAGLEALTAHLEQAAQASTPSAVIASTPSAVVDSPVDAQQPGFRLSVDRSFSLAGVGTVVTGTAVSGQVRVGDNLVVSPSGKPVRVRSLHAHNQAAESGHQGQRLALNVSGIDKAEVQRGDWLVAPALHAPTQCLDVMLSLLPGEARPLAHRTPVHVHLGTLDVHARVNLLDRRELAPGDQAAAQLELDQPIGALHGDRFIVRDASATRTLGGGRVADIFSTPQRRHKLRHAPQVQAFALPDAASAWSAVLAVGAEQQRAEGWPIGRMATLWNLGTSQAEALAKQAGARVLTVSGVPTAFSAAAIEQQLGRVTQVLSAHHRKSPDSPGLSGELLWKSLDPRKVARPSPPVYAAWLAEAQSRGLISREGVYWRLKGHEATLLPAELKLWQRIEPWLIEGGIQPPKLSELMIRDRSLHKDHVSRLLAKLVRMGKLYAVGVEYVLLPRVMLQLAQAAQALAEADEHRRLEVKALRERTGMSRHFSMPLVEFFDHIGFTKRDSVGRKVRRDATEMFGAAADQR